MSRLFLLDGHNLAFRAFYAINAALTTKDGRPTNALYGFALMLNKMIEQHQPEYVVVTFDRGKPTIHLEQYAEYKAQREKTPPELIEQLPYIKQMIEAFGINIYEVDGHEADDVIGTLTRHAESLGIESIIVTADRDALQLVSPLTKVMLPKKGVTETELMDEEGVRNKYGLSPLQLIDLKALMGDASDNIKGVKGVGEKTALALIQQFGSVENVYENLDKISKQRLRTLLEDDRDSALLSKYLATIVRDVDLGFELCQFKKLEVDRDRLATMYKDLELGSLLARLQKEEPEPQQQRVENLTFDDLVPNREVIPGTLEITKSLLAKDTLGVVVTCQPSLSMLISDGDELYSYAQESAQDGLRLLESQQRKVIRGYKECMTGLQEEGCRIAGEICDVELAAYLLDPSRPSYTMESLLERYLGVRVDDSAQATIHLIKLWEHLREELMDKNLWSLYSDVELPLSSVLVDMERVGFSVDIEVLKEMEVDVDRRLTALVSEIHRLAGEEFNIASPKQLSLVLFEKLGLPVIKKTKTGYSTDAEVLETLAEQHDIVRNILEYRTLAKLKSTYLQGLQREVGEDGKVHTTYKQTVTATGRLSSTEPNLQNIPIRLPEGRLIRRAFCPSPPFTHILAADYSQIELRILAHLSGDAIMTEAFVSGEDVHRRTAAEVFGVAAGEVTREMRDKAKAVNFGIVYGISDFGLARDIKVSRREAKEYITNYFARYQGVKDFIDAVIKEAKIKGYVTTMLNRRRYLPDINNRNFSLRSFAERTAMNTPIQGTAADLIKLAMVRISDEIKRRGLKSRMILQVHDELIFETLQEEIEELKKLVKETMEQALQLSVPLVVDLKVGDNWYNVKQI